jgi:hypothetical protein
VRTTKALPVPTEQNVSEPVTFGQRLRVVASNRAEEILAEVAPTLRRLRIFLVVATISIPVFLAGLVAILWRLAR